MYTTVKLLKVEENRSITRDADIDFFYRNAEETLKEQRRAIIRARIEGGSTS